MIKNPRASILAAAVLALAGSTAHAQGNVTIYGTFDLGVSRMDQGQSTLTFLPQALIGRPDTVTVRPTTSSRLGFRGSEDLGGGLKASFLLEHRFAGDSGGSEPRDGARASVASVFFNGAAWVGIAGSFGELRLGRQFVPAFYVAAGGDPWGYDYNLAGALGFTRGGNGATTAYNAVTYQTPQLHGFSSQWMVAAGEGDSAQVNPPAGGTPVAALFKGRVTGFNLQVRNGPLWAGYGWHDTQQVATTRKNRYWTAGAAYDFGVARAIFSLSEGQNNVADNAKAKAMVVGATVPLGTGTLKLVAARMNAPVGLNFNASNPALPTLTGGQDTQKFGIGYEHALSKRTSVHVDYGSAKTQTVSRTTGMEAGLKHVF